MIRIGKYDWRKVVNIAVLELDVVILFVCSRHQLIALTYNLDLVLHWSAVVWARQCDSFTEDMNGRSSPSLVKATDEYSAITLDLEATAESLSFMSMQLKGTIDDLPIALLAR